MEINPSPQWDGCLFIIEFSFVEDKVCDVFDGVLVYIFHEGFNG